MGHDEGGEAEGPAVQRTFRWEMFLNGHSVPE